MLDYLLSLNVFSGQEPTDPILLRSFLKIWRTRWTTLRVLTFGTDFCDTCMQLKNRISITCDEEARRILINAGNKHRQDAFNEYKLYIDTCKRVEKDPSQTEIHLTFYFAEKVLLPALKRQPGQLHFVTGLKFDIFGVASSNVNKILLYGLPEGHWPQGRTANEVLSMLDNALRLHRAPTAPSGHLSRVTFHCDNCGGQNKKRWVIWYLSFLVMKTYSQVTLHF